MKKLFSLLLLIVGISAASSVAHAETITLTLNEPSVVHDWRMYLVKDNTYWAVGAGQDFSGKYSFSGLPASALVINPEDTISVVISNAYYSQQIAPPYSGSQTGPFIFSSISSAGTTGISLSKTSQDVNGGTMTYEYTVIGSGTATLRIGLQGLQSTSSDKEGYGETDYNYYLVLDNTIEIQVQLPTVQNTRRAQ